MPVIRSADAVVHDLHGSRFTSFANPAGGSRELCAWRLEVAGGTIGVPHRVTREEVLFVLSGELRVPLDDHPLQLAAAGDAIVVPAGSRFGVDNPSAEPATAWVTTSVGLEAVLADGTWISPPWVR